MNVDSQSDETSCEVVKVDAALGGAQALGLLLLVRGGLGLVMGVGFIRENEFEAVSEVCSELNKWVRSNLKQRREEA